jgi:hypothetical protein
LSAIRRRVRVKGARRGGFNKLLNRVQFEKLMLYVDDQGPHGKRAGTVSPAYLKSIYIFPVCSSVDRSLTSRQGF